MSKASFKGMGSHRVRGFSCLDTENTQYRVVTPQTEALRAKLRITLSTRKVGYKLEDRELLCNPSSLHHAKTLSIGEQIDELVEELWRCEFLFWLDGERYLSTHMCTGNGSQICSPPQFLSAGGVLRGQILRWRWFWVEVDLNQTPCSKR